MKHAFILGLAAVAVLAVACLVAAGDMTSYHKRKQRKFMEGIAAEPGVTSFLDGKLLVKVIKKSDKADAKSPTSRDETDMHYQLKSSTNVEIDSSRKRGSPTGFAPSGVIKAWTNVMQMMAEGDQVVAYCHSDVGYGDSGSPPKIPGFSPLIFEMEMIKVKSGGKPAAEARKRWAEDSDKKVSFDDVQTVALPSQFTV